MRGDRPGGPIRWRMQFKSSPAEVYSNSDDGRAAFWAESAREMDGVIPFRFANGYEYPSEISQRHPPHCLQMDYSGSQLRFELTPDGGGGTDLLLVHENVGAEDWQEVHAGWLNVLFPFKAWLDHGIDLRNHDPRRSWDQGYADQ